MRVTHNTPNLLVHTLLLTALPVARLWILVITRRKSIVSNTFITNSSYELDMFIHHTFVHAQHSFFFPQDLKRVQVSTGKWGSYDTDCLPFPSNHNPPLSFSVNTITSTTNIKRKDIGASLPGIVSTFLWFYTAADLHKYANNTIKHYYNKVASNRIPSLYLISVY